MSAIRYLNELETERREIEAIIPSLDDADAKTISQWWRRLSDWWRQRDLGFGDGQGMYRHAKAKAIQWEEVAEHKCEFCGDMAHSCEQFDRPVWVCKQCQACQPNP